VPSRIGADRDPAVGGGRYDEEARCRDVDFTATREANTASFRRLRHLLDALTRQVPGASTRGDNA
jgi:hypothetical protein